MSVEREDSQDPTPKTGRTSGDPKTQRDPGTGQNQDPGMCRTITPCQASRPEGQKHGPAKEITSDQQKFLYAYITEKNREFNRPRGTVGHRPAHRRR